MARDVASRRGTNAGGEIARGWLGRALARCTGVSVSNARPSNRACGSPAHGSPTSIHREAFGFVRQTPAGLGATTLPLRLTSPSSFGDRNTMAHPKLRGRPCLELTTDGVETSRAYVEAGGDVFVNDAALEGSRLEMGGSVEGVAARMQMTLGALGRERR